MDHLDIGRIGEGMALDYLLKKGYVFVEKNFRMPFGEIDIVMRDDDGRWIFVEVKTLGGRGVGLMPEDEMTKAKIIKFKRVVDYYIRRGEFVKKFPEPEIRLDLVAIELEKGSGYHLTNINNCFIKHYEGI